MTRSTTRTHCPYCSLNCGFDLRTEDGVIVDLDRWKQSPLTQGGLCVKGTTAHEQVDHEDRLRSPLVKRNGRLVEATWDEALDAAAAGFRTIAEAHGPDANALLSGGSLTNEKVYLLGKFARLAMRTRHVDYNGRFCMAAAGKANMMAFGADRMMTPLDELRNAEVVVVIGAHISAAFPVALPKYLNLVRRTGGTVIVVDPRAGRFVKPEDLHIALEPGTDAIFFNGLLREIARRGYIDRNFVNTRTTGFEEALASALPFDPETVQRIADVPIAALEQAAELIGGTTRCMFLHGRGPEQQLSGTSNVLSIINVGLACGHVGRPGAGVNMLTGQRNGQGGREWGQRCDQLPAGRSIRDPKHRRTVAARWGVEPHDIPDAGDSYVEILDAAGRREVRGLLSICTNMAVSAPDVRRVDEQLASLDHLVVVDPFLSESARHADVVLPGSTFAEEAGTITTLEGRVIRIDQVVAPVAGVDDMGIIRALAARLGAADHFAHESPAAVFDEMRAVSAGGPIDYSGITLDRLRRDDGVFWPCPSLDHPGTPQLYRERFAHADGLARFHPIVPTEPLDSVDDGYPIVLTTGRLLAQFLSANQTGRIERLQKVAPGPYVELHPETARAYSISKDDRVRITSRQATVDVPWRSNRGLRYDTLFMPYHWPECNVLVSADLDPLSKIPGFKYTAVRIESSRAEIDLRERRDTGSSAAIVSESKK